MELLAARAEEQRLHERVMEIQAKPQQHLLRRREHRRVRWRDLRSADRRRIGTEDHQLFTRGIETKSMLPTS